VGSHRGEDLAVLHPEFSPRELRCYGSMQEYRPFALELAHGQAILPGRPQKLPLAHLSGRVVQEPGEASFLRVDAVGFGKAFRGVGHTQGVGVAFG
jgi:hypothetical protein